MKEQAEKIEAPARLGETVALGGEAAVRRLGFEAMRITGDGVWGPPKNPDSVLRSKVNWFQCHKLVSTFPDEHEVLKSSVVHLSARGILGFWNIASPSRTGCPPAGERWRIKRRYPLSPIGREDLPAASIGVYHRGHRRVMSDMRWQIGLQKDVGLQVRSGRVSLDQGGQGRVGDHRGGRLVKAFIEPEETIACP